MVEDMSTDLKVPGLIPVLVSYRGLEYDEACFMHLAPGVVHNLTKNPKLPMRTFERTASNSGKYLVSLLEGRSLLK